MSEKKNNVSSWQRSLRSKQRKRFFFVCSMFCQMTLSRNRKKNSHSGNNQIPQRVPQKPISLISYQPIKQQRDRRARYMKSRGIFYDNSYCERQLYKTKKNNTSAVCKGPQECPIRQIWSWARLEVTVCDTQPPPIWWKWEKRCETNSQLI